MKKENKEALESLMSGIEYIVEQAISKAPFDKTKVGQILSKNSDNTYAVLLDGNTYNIPFFGNGTISDGSIVKVMIPQNDYNNMFILNS